MKALFFIKRRDVAGAVPYKFCFCKDRGRPMVSPTLRRDVINVSNRRNRFCLSPFVNFVDTFPEGDSGVCLRFFRAGTASFELCEYADNRLIAALFCFLFRRGDHWSPDLFVTFFIFTGRGDSRIARRFSSC